MDEETKRKRNRQDVDVVYMWDRPALEPTDHGTAWHKRESCAKLSGVQDVFGRVVEQSSGRIRSDVLALLNGVRRVKHHGRGQRDVPRALGW